MNRIMTTILVVLVCTGVSLAGGWGHHDNDGATSVSQGTIVNASNLAVGGWGWGWHKPYSAPTVSINSGTWGLSTEAHGDTSIATSMGIFNQQATAGNGSIAGNDLTIADALNASDIGDVLTAGVLSYLDLSSFAEGTAAQASQSAIVSETAIAVSPDGLAAVGSMVGVVQINTAMNGGVAASNVNISGGGSAVVID